VQVSTWVCTRESMYENWFFSPFTEARLCYKLPNDDNQCSFTEAMNDETTEVVLKQMGDLWSLL